MLRDSQSSQTKSLRGFLGTFLLTAATLTAAQSGPAPQPAPPPAPRFVVVLDASHGGGDTGGRLGDEQEKAFTLALSVRLRSLLAARGIQVITTREADTDLDANRRAEIANHANAQACLSLHASATGSGIHLFASSLAPAGPAKFPAWKTAQAAWVSRSVALAGVVHSVLLHADLPVSLGRTTLASIDSMTCPAIVIEVSPARGPGNSVTAGLDDPAYQARVAEALAAALLEWKTEVHQP